MSAALLMGLAVLVWRAGASGSARLRDLGPDPEPRGPGLTPSLVRATCGLAALGAWAVLGGAFGLGVGLAVVLGGPWVLGRLPHDEAQDVAVAAELPLALDLLAACLAGGAVPRDAVAAVAEGVGGPCGSRLAVVAARLGLGAPAPEAWAYLGTGRGPAGAAARAMARAATGGAPVAAAVQRVADDARRDARAAAERAARRAGVLAVGPLGLCFLPAFLLVGVVPAVVGLAGPLLASL